MTKQAGRRDARPSSAAVSRPAVARPGGRTATRAITARPDRRGWLSHGIAALAISALGLAAAGSMSLTTSAQPTSGAAPVTVVSQARAGQAGTVNGQAAAVPGTPGAGAADQGDGPAEQPAAAADFAARDSGLDTSRSQQLRAALAKERAAQRAEDLAQTAEAVSRAARDEASRARQSKLDDTELQIQQNAVSLAWERQKRAIAARVAARAAVTAASAATDATTAGTTGQSTGTQSSGTTSGSTTAVDPDPAAIPTGGRAASPVPGAVIGASFGQTGLWARYHTGLDFRAAMGTPIRAVLPGVVVFAGNTGDWAGNHVAIRHADGMTTMSSHMSRMAVSAGQTVQAGQIIGYVGQTGRAFGPHLHFELYPAGVKYGDVYSAIDPLPYLRAHGLQTH